MRSLKADLHTHTVASGHGYSTVFEMAQSAAVLGVELIGIADHGPGLPGGAHPYHFWNLKALPVEIEGVRVLKGVEANVVSEAGALDLPGEVLELLDFVGVGFHPGPTLEPGDADTNTRAMLAVLANPLVDMITHPGNDEFPVHLEPVVEAAARHGVILELNSHSFDPTGARASSMDREREMAAAAYAARAPMSIGSDAHYRDHVGRFDAALAVAEDLGIPTEYFVNRDAGSVISFLEQRRPRRYLHPRGA